MDEIQVTLTRDQLQSVINILDILKSALDGAAAQSDAAAMPIEDAPEGIDYEQMVGEIEGNRGSR